MLGEVLLWEAADLARQLNRCHDLPDWIAEVSNDLLKVKGGHRPAEGQGIESEGDAGYLAGSALLLCMLFPDRYGILDADPLTIFGWSGTQCLTHISTRPPVSGYGVDSRRTNAIEALLNYWQDKPAMQDIRSLLLETWRQWAHACAFIGGGITSHVLRFIRFIPPWLMEEHFSPGSIVAGRVPGMASGSGRPAMSPCRRQRVATRWPREGSKLYRGTVARDGVDWWNRVAILYDDGCFRGCPLADIIVYADEHVPGVCLSTKEGTYVSDSEISL
jgi:hypothetical protein